MKYRMLGQTGLKVSALSFGASSLGGVFHDVDEKEGIRTVHAAVDGGINFIDVSPYYGLTKAETVLGRAIREIRRDRFILSTKAGRYGADEFDFSAARIMQSVDESLQRLQTDYIDIFYLHDIEFGLLQQVIDESVPALNELKRQGKIRFTGISGLPLAAFKKVLNSAHVDSVLSYCHYSLNDQSLLGFVPYLKEKQVGLVNASPLSMGLLSGSRPPDWHPASDRLKRKCEEAASLCRAEGILLPKLAIQFSIAHDDIPTTLVSTANPAHMERNIAWAEEPIDMPNVQRLLHFFEPLHNETWPSGRKENN